MIDPQSSAGPGEIPRTRLTARRRFAVGAVFGLLVAGGAGCANPDDVDPLRIVQRFGAAVHDRDHEALARVDASAPPVEDEAAFEQWIVGVETVLTRYELQRDAGFVEPDERGYAIVRASQLGRGLYWDEVGRRETENGLEIDLKANFGYGSVNYSTYPRGTQVYLMGYPLGKIHRIRLGRGLRHEMDVLNHLILRVRLQKTDPEQHTVAYKVEGIEWIEQSADHSLVEWIF